MTINNTLLLHPPTPFQKGDLLTAITLISTYTPYLIPFSLHQTITLYHIQSLGSVILPLMADAATVNGDAK